MRLRPFKFSCDFEEIKNWITDERTHAMWCANLIKYPLEKENFCSVMLEAAVKFGDNPFVVATDAGKVIGFFCYSTNLSTNEGKLKFIMVNPAERGKGFGKAMVQLAIQYAFNITKVDSVQLNIFSENMWAKKCYENVGFITRKTDVDVFGYRDEVWSRCNMVIMKE